MEGRAGECEGVWVCLCEGGECSSSSGVAIHPGQDDGGFAVDGGVIVVLVCV